MSRAYYITTPIYYVNGDLHIGHTYTTVLADSLTRHYRLRGYRTFFLTGSDEHGEKVLEVARKRGETPAETAEFYATRFRETWDELGISYDRFIRTTDPDHKRVVSALQADPDPIEVFRHLLAAIPRFALSPGFRPPRR